MAVGSLFGTSLDAGSPVAAALLNMASLVLAMLAMEAESALEPAIAAVVIAFDMDVSWRGNSIRRSPMPLAAG